MYVRNEKTIPVTANGIGAQRFELAAKGNAGSIRVLPTSVAKLPGFQRLWAKPGFLTVSQNADLSSPITTIPEDELLSDDRVAAAVSDSAATTVAGLKTDLNALLATLRNAGLLAET